jgi:murein DD-endopeptidase MepM/ murein hydrolase activator NlpD
MISNPFAPPEPGSDNPHQGIDFSDRDPGSQMALSGRAVQAVLSGRVAGVVRDRFPYGNALLIETPIEGFPTQAISALNLPGIVPTLESRSALTCPDGPVLEVDAERRSLYLLYAHLLEAPTVEAGGIISCGQVIGAIGASGNALNPHLHLEARIGPSGARFESLAHYDSSATVEEMSNYCIWRVSNLFQVVDPLRLLTLEN